jgi:hypothetical protein
MLQLGAMQLERDVRAITAFLTSRTDAAIRDKFTRLSQICTVLAVEEVLPRTISEAWSR